jgi:thioredoxin reductase (NADPH)
MCPDTVVSAQRIASLNENVTAEVYDIHHFEKIRKKYNVMSVPCVVLNDENLSFGKKNIEGLLDIIK